MSSKEIIEILNQQNFLLKRIIDREQIFENVLTKIFEKLGDKKEFLTVPEVAEKLRKHPGTIRRWIAERRLPAKKLNGGVRQDHYLVHVDEVRKLLTVQKGGRIEKNRST